MTFTVGHLHGGRERQERPGHPSEKPQRGGTSSTQAAGDPLVGGCHASAPPTYGTLFTPLNRTIMNVHHIHVCAGTGGEKGCAQ